MSETLTKEYVRLNRERIRNNIRASLTNTQEQSSQTSTKPLRKVNLQQNLKTKPNSSDKFEIFDDSSYLNHIFPCSTFETMFQLLQKIGQGSHSEVYKCRELTTNKIFAVKLFMFLEPQNMRHIKQHYRIKKLLSHQNLVKANFLFFHLQKKRMAIVREYCPYGTLRSYMQKNHEISNSALAKIIFKLMNGISYMHQNGVCHRDLKPQNIMYGSKTGELKIIDFELAKMRKYVNKKLEMWTNTGSLHYKAPEMFKGSYNEAIDMWAVGVVIYEMVYKKLPFHSDYVSDTIIAICEKQPDYESVEVHPCLLLIIKGCLMKKPEKRLKATQALKSPFILKYAEGFFSPRMRKKRKPDTDNEQEKHQDHFKLKLKQVSKESYSEDDERTQDFTFLKEIQAQSSHKH